MASLEVLKLNMSRVNALGALFCGAMVAASCADPDIDGLAQEYCEYFANAEEMSFEQKQKVITALDRRLIEKNVRQGRMRSALQQACPAVLAHAQVELMGIMGQDLREMQKQMRELSK